ncbi:MAG: hypothetical protein H6705_16820 [Myxococcales bacterium]|nr:hypothetical protein [Myxococcales bacterium]
MPETDVDRWCSWVHHFFKMSPSVKGRWLPSNWEQAFVGRCDGVTLSFRWLDDCRTDVCAPVRRYRYDGNASADAAHPGVVTPGGRDDEDTPATEE